MATAPNVSGYVSISHSTVEYNCTMFDHKGLRLVPDEDLHGQNIVQLQFTVLHEELNITTAMARCTSFHA